MIDIDTILYCDVLDTLSVKMYKHVKTPKLNQTRTGTPPKLKTEIERSNEGLVYTFILSMTTKINNQG